jgi:hypothetical protein
MRWAIAALLMVVAVVVLAACGGGGDETTVADFRKVYAPISAEVRALGDDVGAAVQGAADESDASLATEFADLAERTNEVAAELAGADVPDDTGIQTTRADLVAGLRDAAGDLAAISRAAESSDADAAKAATIALLESSGEIRTPRLKLDRLVLGADAPTDEEGQDADPAPATTGSGEAT